MRRNLFIVLLLLLLSFQAAAQTPPSLRIGILGDSASDEYRANDARGGSFWMFTYNWVEQARDLGIFKVGTWGTRAEPRRTGNQYNFARTGAHTYDLPGQANGLAVEIAAARAQGAPIGAVVIWAGANDFAPYANGRYNDICTGALAGSALATWIAQTTDYIAQAVDIIRAAEPTMRLLIATIPDVNFSPSANGCGDPNGPARVTAAIIAANAQIASIIQEAEAATLDAAAILTRLPGNAQQIVNASGGAFNLTLFGVGDNPINGILGDGIHSGTILNCITANEVIDAFNLRYTLGLPRITPAQCLARVGYGAAPTATPTSSSTATTAPPTLTPSSTPPPTNTAVPTDVPTVAPSPTFTEETRIPPTDIPTQPPVVPTSIPTDVPPPSATPGCAVNNPGYAVDEPIPLRFESRPLGFSYPASGDVHLIGRTFLFVPDAPGVYTINFYLPGDVTWTVCFTVN